MAKKKKVKMDRRTKKIRDLEKKLRKSRAFIRRLMLDSIDIANSGRTMNANHWSKQAFYAYEDIL